MLFNTPAVLAFLVSFSKRCLVVDPIGRAIYCRTRTVVYTGVLHTDMSTKCGSGRPEIVKKAQLAVSPSVACDAGSESPHHTFFFFFFEVGVAANANAGRVNAGVHQRTQANMENLFCLFLRGATPRHRAAVSNQLRSSPVVFVRILTVP